MPRCEGKGCKNTVEPQAMKPGQSWVGIGEATKYYCSEICWEEHLKEVLPRH